MKSIYLMEKKGEVLIGLAFIANQQYSE